MSYFAGLSKEDLFLLVNDLQLRLNKCEKDLEEQLNYVSELEEGVRTLAERLEVSNATLSSQTAELQRSREEKIHHEQSWKAKLDLLQSSHDKKVNDLLQKIKVLQEENVTYNQLMNEMEDIINTQQSRMIDLETQIMSAAPPQSEDVEETVECAEENAADLSLLSGDSDEDEEISPVDLKISRNLSMRKSNILKKAHDRDENDESIRFRQAKGVDGESPTTEKKFGGHRDSFPVPPLPPPSPLGKFDRSLLRSRELLSASVPAEAGHLPPAPATKVAWKDEKKHASLFQPVTAVSEDERVGTKHQFQWYIEEDESEVRPFK